MDGIIINVLNFYVAGDTQGKKRMGGGKHWISKTLGEVIINV